MQKVSLLLICFFITLFSDGQDTLTFYFEVNSADLSYNDRSVLSNISTQYDVSSFDSIVFIGFSDSTGNFRSNLKLSERRANNTFKSCKYFLGKDIPFRILAKGENIRAENWESRRVELIIYQKKEYDLNPEEIEIVTEVDPRCFFVDFEALEYCNVREIKKGNKKYVQIEAMNIPLFKEQKHYYVLYGANNKVAVQRLNWKLKTTGRSWWEKQRLVATIPKAGFDKFQFFTLADAPCSGCTETILTKDTIILTYQKYYPDVFLMDNMQVNVKLFGSKVKLRVPKEYVDLSAHYYYGTTPTSPLVNYEIEWTEKNARRKEDYYFSTITTSLLEPVYIKKMGYTTVCLNDYSYLRYRVSYMNCGGGIGGSFAIATSIQPGIFYHNDTLTSYFTAGFNFKGFVLSAGINHRSGFYGSLVYNRGLFSFPLSALSIKDHWRSLEELPKKNKQMIIYLGADLRTSFNKKYQSFLETNLHLGTNLFHKYFRRFQLTTFIQGGYAYDFLRRINDKPYPYAELGVRFDFILM